MMMDAELEALLSARARARAPERGGKAPTARKTLGVGAEYVVLRTLAHTL